MAPSTPKVDAVVEKAKAAAAPEMSAASLYGRFALAGAICCSVTHGALTPVDVYVVPPSAYVYTVMALGTLNPQPSASVS